MGRISNVARPPQTAWASNFLLVEDSPSSAVPVDDVELELLFQVASSGI